MDTPTVAAVVHTVVVAMEEEEQVHLVVEETRCLLLEPT